MGVYVKGMKFPDSCCVCPIMNQDDGYCEVNHDRADDIWNRPDWCPLVEIDEPYGELIDLVSKRDVLDDIDKMPVFKSDDGTEFVHKLMTKIRIELAPTATKKKVIEWLLNQHFEVEEDE